MVRFFILLQQPFDFAYHLQLRALDDEGIGDTLRVSTGKSLAGYRRDILRCAGVRLTGRANGLHHTIPHVVSKDLVIRIQAFRLELSCKGSRPLISQ